MIRFWRNFMVGSEELRVIRGVGLFLESRAAWTGWRATEFIPEDMVREAVVHEVMYRGRFRFLLALALSRPVRPIRLVFGEYDLRYPQIQAMYQDLHDHCPWLVGWQPANGDGDDQGHAMAAE
ncbi:hypothetical protein H9P43_009812 [Blastocladiella emersonii ATCC 22665]|nr:hypothetical protein H9P43_009812 [Blastocladiella emersonii ATCC 22665]